jgi:isochorismate synthase EntC
MVKLVTVMRSKEPASALKHCNRLMKRRKYISNHLSVVCYMSVLLACFFLSVDTSNDPKVIRTGFKRVFSNVL